MCIDVGDPACILILLMLVAGACAYSPVFLFVLWSFVRYYEHENVKFISWRVNICRFALLTYP